MRRLLAVLLLASSAWAQTPTPAPPQGYRTVEDEGADLKRRRNLNFTGAGVACADNVSDDRTDCTIAGGGGVSDGDKGDITVTGSGATWTIDGDVVTFAKMQNIATDRLIGRDTAASGDPEEITVTGGLEWTGTGGIQRSALAGDVTASAGSGTTDLDEAAVEVELEGVLDLPDLQGVLTAAKGGTGDDTSAATGVPQVTAGNWTYDAGVGDLGDDIACTGSQVVRRNAGDTGWECATISGGGAPTTAEYVTTQDDAGLSADVFPGADDQVATSDSASSGSWKTLPNGAVSYATAGNTFAQAGVSNLAASTSADLRGVLSDEEGSGPAMFGLTPAMADSLSCTGDQVVKRNAGDTAFECGTVSGGSGLTHPQTMARLAVGGAY